jgi:hypothetical protein
MPKAPPGTARICRSLLHGIRWSEDPPTGVSQAPRDRKSKRPFGRFRYDGWLVSGGSRLMTRGG